MGHYRINEKDPLFILKDQLHYGRLCQLERYKDLDEDTLDMTVLEGIKFAKGVLDPLQEIGEHWGIQFENNKVRCAPEYKEAFRLYGANGWIAASRGARFGGQGFPNMMRIVANDFMYGATQAFNMLASLTHGAAHLIEGYATEELKEQYVAKMYSGQWAGTMCLTEPSAGSNLAALRTMAYPEGDHYKIKGTKMFISWGEHDLTDNIVHLVLARIEGAPEGIKGISLFIVPKIRVNPDGSLGESNDVLCAGVERKLGLHASPTCVLNFGDNDQCIGYLCGQANQGLPNMFQMMNESRINVGVSGMTLASTAYFNALAYTKERVQGADVAGRKSGYVPIIDHPDVRRMLLWMKATVDGMRSMIYTGAFWSDLAHDLLSGEEKVHYNALLDFMTPIIKAYCSDMGFRVCETAIQCLGGYGFCREYPLEQYLRDSKIMSLYEGTNGIQAMDLMGRKMRINDGAPFKAFMKEVNQFCEGNENHPVLGAAVRDLAKVTHRLGQVALELAAMSKSDPLHWAATTYPALLCFGDVTTAWRLLDLARVAQEYLEKDPHNPYYAGKVMQATYWVGVTLPETSMRIETCLRKGREVVEMPVEAF